MRAVRIENFDNQSFNPNIAQNQVNKNLSGDKLESANNNISKRILPTRERGGGRDNTQ